MYIFIVHPGHAAEGYMVIFNVGHLGSLITTHYLGSRPTRCCYKIRNINRLHIIPWISYLNNLRNRSDTEAAKHRRGIVQKPKVIRKFNESREKNRSWLLFK